MLKMTQKKIGPNTESDTRKDANPEDETLE